MDAELRDKVARLPAWARNLIKRLETANEPMVEEVVKLRREAERSKEIANRYRDANHALMELLSKAGFAGLDWARAVVDTLNGYEIFRGPKEDE